MWRRFGSLLLAVTVLAIAGPGQSARGQDVARPEEDETPRPQPQPALTLTDRVFDRLAFGLHFNGDKARQLLAARLKSTIESLDQLYGITPDQRKKLEVAGRGDIKRFFDRLAEKRDQFQLAATNRTTDLQQVLKELQELSRGGWPDAFGAESMFGKTLRRVLKPEQRVHYEQKRENARLDIYHSRVQWALLTLQKSLSLSDDQSFRLLIVLVEETPPPQHFGEYDYYVVMYQASRLPESRLRPIFDDTQWNAMRQEFDEVKLRERTLKEQGYLPLDRPDVDPACEEGAPL
jgi:hypothetical protein